jgi:ribonuclease HII
MSKTNPSLQTCFSETDNEYEIGIDEAGRGPLFGRLYVAAVVLPKDTSFRHQDMKDSKKFTSKTKIRQTAEYIKEHALAYHVEYVEADVIDSINIRQAVFRGMHECIRQVLAKLGQGTIQGTGQGTGQGTTQNVLLLVDGNDFKPYMVYNEDDTGIETLTQIPHITIEGGDNKYTAIAAASILAKVARDDYIAELCEAHPELVERYGIHTNMGYGTKAHLTGILEHGITQWHRKTYGRCAGSPENFI